MTDGSAAWVVREANVGSVLAQMGGTGGEWHPGMVVLVISARTGHNLRRTAKREEYVDIASPGQA